MGAILSLPWALIFAVLLAISEGLSLIPWIKANGIFEAIFSAIKWFASKFPLKQQGQ